MQREAPQKFWVLIFRNHTICKFEKLKSILNRPNNTFDIKIASWICSWFYKSLSFFKVVHIMTSTLVDIFNRDCLPMIWEFLNWFHVSVKLDS